MEMIRYGQGASMAECHETKREKCKTLGYCQIRVSRHISPEEKMKWKKNWFLKCGKFLITVKQIG